MKIGISNIAWQKEDDDQVYNLLHELGVRNLEISPSRVNPAFNEYLPSKYEKYLATLKEFNLSVTSTQAILFGKENLNIFNDSSWNEFFKHLEIVLLFAQEFGINKLVFGSPRSRIYNTNLTEHSNLELAKLFFQKFSQIASKYNIYILLEPNPKIYKCDFLNTHSEVLDFVKIMDLPNLKMHVDTGAAIIEGEVGKSFLLQKNFEIEHVHLSMPSLDYNFTPCADFFYSFFEKLIKTEYNGLCIVEMTTKSGSIEKVRESLSFFLDLKKKIENI